MDSQLDVLKQAFSKLEDLESSKILLYNLASFMQQVAQTLFSSSIKEIVLNREVIRSAMESRLRRQSENEGGFRFHEFYDELRAVTIAIINKPPPANENTHTVSKR